MGKVSVVYRKFEGKMTILPLVQERISNIGYDVVNSKCDPIKDDSAPIYITIGDGGNLEGLAIK